MSDLMSPNWSFGKVQMIFIWNRFGRCTWK